MGLVASLGPRRNSWLAIAAGCAAAQPAGSARPTNRRKIFQPVHFFQLNGGSPPQFPDRGERSSAIWTLLESRGMLTLSFFFLTAREVSGTPTASLASSLHAQGMVIVDRDLSGTRAWLGLLAPPGRELGSRFPGARHLARRTHHGYRERAQTMIRGWPFFAVFLFSLGWLICSAIYICLEDREDRKVPKAEAGASVPEARDQND